MKCIYIYKCLKNLRRQIVTSVGHHYASNWQLCSKHFFHHHFLFLSFSQSPNLTSTVVGFDTKMTLHTTPPPTQQWPPGASNQFLLMATDYIISSNAQCRKMSKSDNPTPLKFCYAFSCIMMGHQNKKVSFHTNDNIVPKCFPNIKKLSKY